MPFRVFLVKLTDWRANEALEERTLKLLEGLANLMIDGSEDFEFPSEAKNGKPSGQSTYLRIASP